MKKEGAPPKLKFKVFTDRPLTTADVAAIEESRERGVKPKVHPGDMDFECGTLPLRFVVAALTRRGATVMVDRIAGYSVTTGQPVTVRTVLYEPTRPGESATSRKPRKTSDQIRDARAEHDYRRNLRRIDEISGTAKDGVSTRGTVLDIVLTQIATTANTLADPGWPKLQPWHLVDFQPEGSLLKASLAPLDNITKIAKRHRESQYPTLSCPNLSLAAWNYIHACEKGMDIRDLSLCLDSTVLDILADEFTCGLLFSLAVPNSQQNRSGILIQRGQPVAQVEPHARL